MRRVLLMVFSLLALLLPFTVFGGASPAAADDAHGCDPGHNSENARVLVCFKSYGDRLYVKDKMADGLRATGVIIFGGSQHYCQNANGAGTWVSCGYSELGEGQVLPFYGACQNGPSGNLVYKANQAQDMT